MLKYLKCIECSYEWLGLFPEGIDGDTVECPNCGKDVKRLIWKEIK